MIKHVAEVPLTDAATLRELLDAVQKDGEFAVPGHAELTVKTESRSRHQLDRGPLEQVPVALIFTWET